MSARRALVSITVILGLWGCTTTNVSVGDGAGGSGGGNASPSTICARLSVLACTPPKDTCVADVTNDIDACTGSAAQKQALLDCLGNAHYDCSGGPPATHDCDGQYSAAGCSPTVSSTSSTSSSSSTTTTSSSSATTGTSSSSSGTVGGVCNDLCQNGIPATYKCTSNQGPFTVQVSVGSSDCPNFAPVGTPVCFATQTSFNGAVMLSNLEFDCDGSIRDSGIDPCPMAGSWSLQGSTLNVDLSQQGVAATCTKQ